MVFLLVDYSGEDFGNPLEDTARLAWTIGFNGYDHNEIDEWSFAGWNWSQDCFTQGRGRVVGWAPMPSLEVKP
jgi:hypothetical protein